MKEINLRKWHRLAGSLAAPLIILQAASGVFLKRKVSLGNIGNAIMPGRAIFKKGANHG